MGTVSVECLPRATEVSAPQQTSSPPWVQLFAVLVTNRVPWPFVEISEGESAPTE